MRDKGNKALNLLRLFLLTFSDNGEDCQRHSRGGQILFRSITRRDFRTFYSTIRGKVHQVRLRLSQLALLHFSRMMKVRSSVNVSLVKI